MPLIIGIIILASALIPTYNFVSNKIKNNKPPKIERIQNYTMDQLRLSTLTEKYGNYDYPGETEIEFNGCRYKVIDNKSGGRKFEPKDNCPPLILTTIPYEKYLEITKPTITPTPNLVKNQNFNNTNPSSNNINSLNSNLNQTNIVSDNQNTNYVRCHFPHSGVLILKKEECDKLIDCQINDNLWTPLAQEECKKRQEGYIDEKVKEFEKYLNSFSNQNYQIPTIPPIPTYDSSSFYKRLEDITNEKVYKGDIYERYKKEIEEIKNEAIRKMQESIPNKNDNYPYRSSNLFNDCLNRLGERGRPLCEAIYKK